MLHYGAIAQLYKYKYSYVVAEMWFDTPGDSSALTSYRRNADVDLVYER